LPVGRGVDLANEINRQRERVSSSRSPVKQTKFGANSLIDTDDFPRIHIAP
jgi:hypothetical protein